MKWKSLEHFFGTKINFCALKSKKECSQSQASDYNSDPVCQVCPYFEMHSWLRNFAKLRRSWHQNQHQYFSSKLGLFGWYLVKFTYVLHIFHKFYAFSAHKLTIEDIFLLKKWQPNKHSWLSWTYLADWGSINTVIYQHLLFINYHLFYQGLDYNA